jgi:hypothetical protein
MDDAARGRFWLKVERFGADGEERSGCWEWAGRLSASGYGSYEVARRATRAHRVAFEIEVGEIPSRLDLDHLCLNRACVRPDHLEPITRAENVRRGMGGRQTHCPRGHALTKENVFVRDDRYPTCLICKRKANLESYYRRKQIG